jgi:hypothetical protein
MAVRVECFVLLRSGWQPDMAAFAARLAERFPPLGSVEGQAAEAQSGVPHRLVVDGARVDISVVNAPYPVESLAAPVRLVDHVDPRGFARDQLAYVMVGADAPEGAELVEAFSALVVLVAAQVARESPSLAVFWSSSWRLMPPSGIETAAGRIMAGEAPRELWISWAELTGERAGGEGNRCLMSFGLRAFVGREVEMAPAPIAHGSAQAMCRRLADRLLDGAEFADREELRDEVLDRPATLRLADRFLRPAQPAVVIVAQSSPIEAETLRPRRVEQPRGLFGRLLGR